MLTACIKLLSMLIGTDINLMIKVCPSPLPSCNLICKCTLIVEQVVFHLYRIYSLKDVIHKNLHCEGEDTKKPHRQSYYASLIKQLGLHPILKDGHELADPKLQNKVSSLLAPWVRLYAVTQTMF